jgi:hypothetical protein
MVTITFNAPAVPAGRSPAVFSHHSDSPVADQNGNVQRPARKAGTPITIRSNSETVAQTIAEMLAREFAVTQTR